MNMTRLADSMVWRYATKRDGPVTFGALEKVDAIIESVRLAPTSNGLQPSELLVVTNRER